VPRLVTGTLSTLFIAAACASVPVAAAPTSEAPSQLELQPADRVLVLAPHPDDETIGAGGLIQKALELNCRVHVAWLTNGDFNEWSFIRFSHRPAITPAEILAMGRRRESEARLASSRLGLSPRQLTFLGYPDHGTLAIWRSHWNRLSPYRALLSSANSVPYPSALHPSAPYTGRSILEDLESVIRSFEPTVIAVSHPADHHPDHRALYLFTRFALWDLDLMGRVRLVPYLVHYPGWPESSTSSPSSPLQPPPTLNGISWKSLPLTSHEVAIKAAALQEHRTQLASGRKFLTRFLRPNELFGDFDEIVLPSTSTVTELPLSAPGSPELPTEDLMQTSALRHPGLIRELRLRRHDADLVFEISLTRSLRLGDKVVLELAGWRRGPRPVAPTELTSTVEFDHLRLRTLRPRPHGSGATLRRSGRRLTLRVPLSNLDSPSRLLMDLRLESVEKTTHLLPIRVISLPSD